MNEKKRDASNQQNKGQKFNELNDYGKESETIIIPQKDWADFNVEWKFEPLEWEIEPLEWDDLDYPFWHL